MRLNQELTPRFLPIWQYSHYKFQATRCEATEYADYTDFFRLSQGTFWPSFSKTVSLSRNNLTSLSEVLTVSNSAVVSFNRL
jgi:hypothetical protein